MPRHATAAARHARLAGLASLGTALGLIVLAGATLAAPAPVTVFRCVEAGKVLYTDAPCADGGPVDIEVGAPARDARERLQRDQQALDQGARQWREAQVRDEAMRRAAAADERARRDMADAAAGGGSYAADYAGYGYFYDGLHAHDRRANRREHPRDVRHRLRMQRVVPVPPPVPETLRRR
jgi:hypothetical protein